MKRTSIKKTPHAAIPLRTARSALKKLLAKKGAAAPAPAAASGTPEEEGRVIDLLEALRASVARRGGRSPRKRRVA